MKSLPCVSSVVTGIFSILGILAFLSCDWLQFSPYVIDGPESRRDLTQKHLERLHTQAPAISDSFTFAVMGDPGRQLNGVHDIVRDINSRDGIHFVLVAGDLSQYGLRREFDWLLDGLEKLTIPFLTVVGNHDGIANGKQLYRAIFGPYDYSFVYGGTKIIVMNTNRWEFGNGVPDFSFLDSELADADEFSSRIIFSHIAPFGEQFTDADELRFRTMLASHSVSLSIHGHAHSYYLVEPYSDGVRYLVVDDAGDRNYALIHVRGDSVRVERRFF